MHSKSEVRYFVRFELSKEDVEGLADEIKELPCNSLGMAMFKGGDYDCDTSYWDAIARSFWWAPKLPIPPQIGWRLLIPGSDPLDFAFLDIENIALDKNNVVIA